MKKLILIFTILISFGVANAQWYRTHYGVTNINELTKEQCDFALEKANKTIKTGKTMTVIGAGACIIGAIMYSSGLNEIVSSTTMSGIDEGLDKGLAGAYILGAGGIIAGIGIPVWISGESQKTQIEIALIKFKDTSYVPSFGLKITF